MPCRGFFNGGNYGHIGGYNGGGMFIMMGFGLVILLLIVFLIFKMTRQNAVPNVLKNDNSSLNILDERFAKGEISEEEYIKVKTMLKK